MLGASVVHADASSDAAHEALKIMTDYVSGLDAISFDLSVDMEAVTTAGIKLQFSASGQMILDRPDRFRVVRTGGHSDIELISDGDTLTLNGRKANAYAQKDAPKSLDEFVNSAREHGIEMPGAGLLISNSHDELTGPVTTAMYLGTGVALMLSAQFPERLAPMGAVLSFFVSPAHAVVGRPLTPVSYAGVARRTARRR